MRCFAVLRGTFDGPFNQRTASRGIGPEHTVTADDRGTCKGDMILPVVQPCEMELRADVNITLPMEREQDIHMQGRTHLPGGPQWARDCQSEGVLVW